MAVWTIAWANLKKKKSVALSMGLLLLLAVAFFHVGFTLILGIQNFYTRENDRLLGPHYMLRFYGNEYEDRYLDFFTADPRVETAESQVVVLMDNAEYENGGAISVTFKNMDRQTSLKGYQIIEETPGNRFGVYLPVYFKDRGYQAGQQLTLIFNRKPYSFRIAGFHQSTWLSSSVTSLVDIYMPEQEFLKLYQKIGGGYVLSVRADHTEDLKQLQQDFKEETQIPIQAITMDSAIMEFTLDDMRTGCTLVVTILSAVLLVFSILMTIVAAIVMKFHISNHIESQMVSIGALEAMGYTGTQIQWTVALEFLLIGLAGIPLGIFFSYGIIELLGHFITASVGVSYHREGNLIYDLGTGLLMMTFITGLSQLSAKKAASITPIQALRQGTETHSFRKNPLPLDQTKGPISILLGLKQTIFYKRIYGMTGGIFAALSFACACSVILFFSMGLDQEMVLQLSGYEISDLLIYKVPHADYHQLSKDLVQVPGVRKTVLYESNSVSIDGEFLTCYVSDDFSRLEMASVYQGVFPKYDNEIVVTGVLAKSWNKQIGDSITVQGANGAQAEFIICGLSQTMNTFGRQCNLSLAGYKLLNPSYEPKSIQAYLEPEADLRQVVQEIQRRFPVASPMFQDDISEQKQQAKAVAEEKIANLLSLYGVDSAQYALMADGEIVLSGDTGGYRIDRIYDNRRLFLSNIDIISSSIGMMTFIIVTATFLIILLVFYMVIKTMLIRQQKEFGVYKSLGYTDRQLRMQISASFLPGSVMGITLGLFAAHQSINRLASMMFEQLGVSQMNLTIKPWILVVLGLFMILFSYGISYLLARRMKEITVYELLTEV